MNNPQAVIMPNHEGLDLHLPKKCVYAFLGEEIDRYAREVRGGLCRRIRFRHQDL